MDQEVIHTSLIGVHLIGLAFGLGGAFVADFSFFRTVRKADRISPETVTWMRSFTTVVWLGLGLLALSGVGLFALDPAKYLHSQGFIAKMVLVLVLIINGLLLNFYSTARLTTFNFSQKYTRRDAAWKARKLSFVFGAVSTVTWYFIVFIALFKSMLDFPFWAYIVIFILLTGAAVVGSLVLELLLYRKLLPRSMPENLNNVPLTELAGFSAKAYKDSQEKQKAEQSRTI